VIRAARGEDLTLICAIASASSFSAGWGLAQLERELENSRALFLVAEEDKGVIGYGLLWIVEGEAQIFDLAVNPESRRRGVGKTLLNALIQRSRGRGCARATLEVSADNLAAQTLYQAAGFEVVGRRVKFYNDGSDAVLMDLRL
jgi:ribosomal-protein-alanine N-acetyltransferase